MLNLKKYVLFLSVLLLIIVAGRDCLSQSKPIVYFGINLRYNPIIIYKRYQPLMDYLTEHTPYRFELKVSNDYEETLRQFQQGKTQICSFGDGAYMDSLLKYGAVPILKPLDKEGKPFYRSAVIVPPGSSAKTLNDLKGKKIAFGSHHSITGNLIPRFMFLDKGLRISGLADKANLTNHEAVAREVLRRHYDAGVVKDVIAERYKQYGVRVLAYSDPIPSVPIVVRNDTPPGVVKAVTNALLKLNYDNPADRKLMSRWDDEFMYGFTTASISDYRELSRMFKSIPLGCGRGCHR